MTKEELEKIATRESYCAPFETRVSLTGAERDQLVALGRDGMRYRFIRDIPWLESPLSDVIAFQKNALWDQAIDAAMAKEKA